MLALGTTFCGGGIKGVGGLVALGCFECEMKSEYVFPVARAVVSPVEMLPRDQIRWCLLLSMWECEEVDSLFF